MKKFYTTSNVGFTYLCHEDVQNSNIFFHIMQAQKDELYNHFSNQYDFIECQLAELETKIFKLLKKKHTLTEVESYKVALKRLEKDVHQLDSFLEENMQAFKKALRAYDDKNHTKSYEEEVEDLLNTHFFMNGKWKDESKKQLQRLLVILERDSQVGK